MVLIHAKNSFYAVIREPKQKEGIVLYSPKVTLFPITNRAPLVLIYLDDDSFL